ncbi:hypothetical protein [Streptomyces fuscichromogenes]|nr:hypothetical protein [Streptomyces fuscichromogenes]
MTVDYRTLFADVHRRPGSYGLDGSYGQAVAFIMGCDAGNAWGLLVGFPEWLAMKAGGGANLVWSALVLRIAFPGPTVVTAAETLDQQHDEHAVGALFGLLDEFLADRKGSRGAAAIVSSYLDWQRLRREQNS